MKVKVALEVLFSFSISNRKLQIAATFNQHVRCEHLRDCFETFDNRISQVQVHFEIEIALEILCVGGKIQKLIALDRGEVKEFIIL